MIIDRDSSDSDSSESAEDGDNDSGSDIPWIILIFIIIIIGSVGLYLLFRRKREWERADTVNGVSDVRYIALAGDNETPGGDKNGKNDQDFKRIPTGDSIYDEATEGQVMTLQHNTPTDEGAGSVTTVSTQE